MGQLEATIDLSALEHRTQLNNFGPSCQSIVTRSFFFLSLYFSYFTIGDSGNLLCSVIGQMSLERMRRVAGWCVCAYVLVATVPSSLLSPFHLLASKFLFHLFHASVLPQVRFASLFHWPSEATMVTLLLGLKYLP